MFSAVRRNAWVEPGREAGDLGLRRRLTFGGAAWPRPSGIPLLCDGILAYQRAQVMGQVIRSLSASRRAALAKTQFGDSRTWPDLLDQLDKRTMSHANHVAVMTTPRAMRRDGGSPHTCPAGQPRCSRDRPSPNLR